MLETLDGELNGVVLSKDVATNEIVLEQRPARHGDILLEDVIAKYESTHPDFVQMMTLMANENQTLSKSLAKYRRKKHKAAQKAQMLQEVLDRARMDEAKVSFYF